MLTSEFSGSWPASRIGSVAAKLHGYVAEYPKDQLRFLAGRTLFMNFLQTDLISFARVAENIITCLS